MSSPSNLRWADGPFPLISTPRLGTKETDPFTTAATQMCLVHNIVLRGLNAIYIQAPLISAPPTASLFSAQDRADFLMYIHAWLDFFHTHHAGEEASLFPNIEKAAGVPGLMEPNVEGHDAFKPGVERLEAYVEERIEAGKKDEAGATFDGKRIVELVDAFSEPLLAHLSDEIPTLLDLRQYGDKVPILKITNDEVGHTLGSASKTVALAFFVMNHDHGFEDGAHSDFPPVPWLPNQLLRRVFTWPGRGWWRYSATDAWGKPKALYAVERVSQAGLAV